MSTAPAQLRLEFEPPKPPRTPFWIQMGWHDRHPNYGHPSEYPPASELQPRMMPDARELLKIKPSKNLAEQLEKYIEDQSSYIELVLANYENLRLQKVRPLISGYDHDWPDWMCAAANLNLIRNNITWTLDLIRAAREWLAELAEVTA